MNYDCSNLGATLKDYKPDEIAKYIRLSLSDEVEASDESESVTNQRRLMNEFITRNGNIREKCREFVDDGVSGISFDRPCWKDLQSQSAVMKRLSGGKVPISEVCKKLDVD